MERGRPALSLEVFKHQISLCQTSDEIFVKYHSFIWALKYGKISQERRKLIEEKMILVRKNIGPTFDEDYKKFRKERNRQMNQRKLAREKANPKPNLCQGCAAKNAPKNIPKNAPKNAAKKANSRVCLVKRIVPENNSMKRNAFRGISMKRNEMGKSAETNSPSEASSSEDSDEDSEETRYSDEEVEGSSSDDEPDGLTTKIPVIKSESYQAARSGENQGKFKNLPREENCSQEQFYEEKRLPRRFYEEKPVLANRRARSYGNVLPQDICA